MDLAGEMKRIVTIQDGEIVEDIRN